MTARPEALQGEVERLRSLLADERARHMRVRQWLDIQYAVAAILAGQPGLDEAAPALLQEICTRLGFAFGILREVERQHQVLRSAAIWHEPDPAIAEFAAGAQRLSFARGIGMNGRAWESGRPTWFDDSASSPAFLRSDEARRAGLHAAIAMPLFAGGEIVGMLTFLARSAQPADAERMEMFSALASQIGQFVERRRQEQEIARLGHLYALLSSINRLLVQAPDREGLLAGVCRIAREQGGFEMAAIATYDAGSGVMTPVAGSGGDLEAIGWHRPHCIRSGTSDEWDKATRAVLEARLTFENDLAADPAHGGDMRHGAIRLGYRSGAALPLLSGGTVVGVFLLFSRSVDFFSPRMLKLLGEVVADIAFGLDHIHNRERLAFLAHHDPLTGLPNRALFEDRLGQTLIAAARAGTSVAVLLIDIRRFRAINDTLGRKAGDQLLQRFAHRLQTIAQNPENLARFEGDRFATFLPAPGDPLAIARRIEHGFASMVSVPLQLEDHTLHVSGAVGVAVFPHDGGEVPVLLRNVEAALVNAKATGRKFMFYEPSLNARVAETLRMTGRLQLALDRGEFEVHYQPKVDARGGGFRSVEALVRWRDAEYGYVPPNEFIPLLEEMGLIRDVGFWVMRQGLADRRGWQAAGRQAPRVAVNVSVIQFQMPDFVGDVRALLEEEVGPGIDPGLDIEITESLIMTDVAGTIAKLHGLRQLGIGIAVDDFGTGHSSLAYLARLPIHALKIDRSFVRMMVESSESMMIISTIVALGHGLNLTVVAEGVETEEQAKLLRLMRCDEMQGFHFARPMPAAELVQRLLPRPAGELPGPA
ncbi:hypothetical protein STVA_35020 [Allostella vacuolata]|nr:hypothetical protein STVA_35020 [Stella vacuolata]